ncbi:unnamed protein product [Symbiodinium natans]|uniref:Uncharacterized protein n=1 Tax=Symbiodinium natans TaxID=878477 RepID=A0A812QK20_9DINO|nr:unnamed protein product [Symbiodinium natans]
MDQSHQKICERILQVCQDKIPDSEVFRQVSWIADGHWHWIQQHVPDFGDDSNWLLAQTWDKPSPRLQEADLWEEAARWRLRLAKWGNFGVESGDRFKDSHAAPLSLSDLGDELRKLVECEAAPKEKLWKLLCRLQTTLIAKAEQFFRTKNDLRGCIRSLAEDHEKGRQETLAAVQLAEIIWQFRRQLPASDLLAIRPDVQHEPGLPERVLAMCVTLVSEFVKGEERCLLWLRISRTICADPQVIKISRALKRAFRYKTNSGHVVLARGFRMTWPQLRAISREQRGAPLKEAGAEYYKTVGTGPELFAVVGEQVYYEDKKAWFAYKTSVLQPWFEIQIIEVSHSQTWKDDLQRVCAQKFYPKVWDSHGNELKMAIAGELPDIPRANDFPLRVSFLGCAE